VDGARPRTKRDVIDAVHDNPARVYVEGTAVAGTSWSGVANELPRGHVVHFVGPDPYSDRRFYGRLFRKKGSGEVTAS
jgi:hypothetical protein